MKKKRYGQAVRVTQPCTEDWEKMVGNEQVRFCSHCAKSVNNLSTMTRKEALRLVRRSNGRLCVRYIKDPVTGAPVYAGQLFQISRRSPRMAATVMTASLSLSTFAYAQGGAAAPIKAPASESRIEKTLVRARAIIASPPISEGVGEVEALPGQDGFPIQNAKSEIQNGTVPHGKIWGTVVDVAGAVIPGATFTLLDREGKEVMNAIADYDGVYRLENIPFGKYNTLTTAQHFVTVASEIDVAAEEERLENTTLAVALTTVVVGGVGVGPTSGSNSQDFLMIAVYRDEIDEARNLIAAGADVNKAEDDDDTTPIFAAVENNSVEMVRLLIDFGAKVNVRNNEKQTPLMMINEDTPLELVELLLRSGAKVNRVDKNGDTALIRAASGAKPEVLRALIDAGAKLDVQNNEGVSALMNAANDDNLENVRILLLAGADVNLRDKDGDNAWDYATDDEVESLLVSHGVILDAEDMMDEEPTPEIEEIANPGF